MFDANADADANVTCLKFLLERDGNRLINHTPTGVNLQLVEAKDVKVIPFSLILIVNHSFKYVIKHDLLQQQ